MLSAFEREYEAAYPDHDVHWLDMGSQDALDSIRTESQNPQADIWWGAPMTMFARAGRKDSSTATPLRGKAPYRRLQESRRDLVRDVRDARSHNVQQRDSRRKRARKTGTISSRRAWKGKIVIRSPLASGTMRTVIFSHSARSTEGRVATDSRGFDGSTPTPNRTRPIRRSCT